MKHLRKLIPLFLSIVLVLSLLISTASAEEVTFTFSQSEDIQSTNQFNDNSVVNVSIFSLLFDCLVNQDHEGNYTPGLIDSWETSEDGKTWSFTLREDVCFSNGAPFTTAALATGWDYARGDSTLAAYSTWSIIDHIDIIDDYHMNVILTEPDATFLDNVSKSAYVEPNAFNELGAEEYWKQPLGCGKYTFVSWDPSNQLVFSRNEKYWGENTSNVTRIVFKPITEDITRVSALQTNEVNLIFAVPFEQIATISGNSDLVLEQMPGSMSLWIGTQCDPGSICSDPNFRKALSYSIDRELIAEGIYGNATALHWGAPSFSIGYVAEEEGKHFQYDLEKAAEYLAQSSYNGETIRMICPTTWFPKVNEIVQTLVAMFGDIGVNVDLQLLEGAAYAAARGSGEYDICLQNYRFAVNNARWYWLQFVFNYGKYNYANQEALDLMTATYHAANTELSKQNLESALKLMAEDYAPMLPLLVFETNGAYQKEWSGIKIYADNQYDLRDVTRN